MASHEQGHDHHSGHDRPHGNDVAAGGHVTDPVCGMRVDPATATLHAEHEGAIWTCPMHSGIRRDSPGSCPICGMALEPLVATVDKGPSPEFADITRRFWIGLVLAIPVFVLEMDSHLIPALHHLVPQSVSTWVQFALATPVVLWAGCPFFERAWASLVHRSLNMFTLVAMGTGVAWAYSMVATLAPCVFPDAFRGHGGGVAVYFEAAAIITVLVLQGQVLELRAREQTSGAIKALMNLAPKTARRIAQDGAEADVPVEAVMLATGSGCGSARRYRSTG